LNQRAHGGDSIAASARHCGKGEAILRSRASCTKKRFEVSLQRDGAMPQEDVSTEKKKEKADFDKQQQLGRYVGAAGGKEGEEGKRKMAKKKGTRRVVEQALEQASEQAGALSEAGLCAAGKTTWRVVPAALGRLALLALPAAAHDEDCDEGGGHCPWELGGLGTVGVVVAVSVVLACCCACSNTVRGGHARVSPRLAPQATDGGGDGVELIAVPHDGDGFATMTPDEMDVGQQVSVAVPAGMGAGQQLRVVTIPDGVSEGGSFLL